MSELILDNKLIISILVVALGVLIRWLILRQISQMHFSDENQPRRWQNAIKNTINLLLLLSLILIWMSELRFVALSIAAFVVALVIATREFIQCFLGAIYQASTRLFGIGDWIQVGAHCGEVVRSDWLTTTVLEIDIEQKSYGYTGKTLIIPNNQFVTHSVQNLNYMRRYISHSFTIVRDPDDVNIFHVKAYILQQAEKYCAPFQDVAKRYGDLIEKRLGITQEGPSVRVTTNNLGKNELTISFFCPTNEAVNIEQRLMEDFMAYWYEQREKLKTLKLHDEPVT